MSFITKKEEFLDERLFGSNIIFGHNLAYGS